MKLADKGLPPLGLVVADAPKEHSAVLVGHHPKAGTRTRREPGFLYLGPLPLRA